MIAGISYKTDTDALNDAIKYGVTIWAHGLLNLYSAMESDPGLRNISLIPGLSCEDNTALHWKNGQLLYK